MKFSVDTSDAQAGNDRVARVFKGQRLGRILEQIKKTAKEDVDRAFARETAPSGKPWAERAHSYPWKPLQRIGTLKGLIEVAGTQGTSGGTVRIEAKSAANVIAGAVFYGVKKGPRKMPGRPVAGISRAGKVRIKRFVDRQVDEVK